MKGAGKAISPLKVENPPMAWALLSGSTFTAIHASSEGSHNAADMPSAIWAAMTTGKLFETINVAMTPQATS